MLHYSLLYHSNHYLWDLVNYKWPLTQEKEATKDHVSNDDSYEVDPKHSQLWRRNIVSLTANMCSHLCKGKVPIVSPATAPKILLSALVLI